jgi:uncharacterized phage-like protein YoqJ
MKAAVTGHRPNKLGGEYSPYKGPYSNHIREQLIKFINEMKPTLMISGMALGVDTIWALLAIEFNIPLLCAIPFEGQESVWQKKDKELYHEILIKATIVKYTGTPGYEHYKMDVRNKYMVDYLGDPDDMLVAVYNGDKSGGTFNCVEYAKSQKKLIHYINPKPIINESQIKSNEIDLTEVEGLWDIITQETQRQSELRDSGSSKGVIS